MTNDPWYSSASAAMLIAMTALQRADGVAADVALQSDLTALVARLTG